MSNLSQKKAHVRAAKQTRRHHCHAKGCDKQVKPALFMCARHWYMVPKNLRDQVWEHYSLGQEHGSAEVTEEYLQVTEAAIRAVAEKEGRI